MAVMLSCWGSTSENCFEAVFRSMRRYIFLNKKSIYTDMKRTNSPLVKTPDLAILTEKRPQRLELTEFLLTTGRISTEEAFLFACECRLVKTKQTFPMLT
jgi:hypothetical protein